MTTVQTPEWVKDAVFYQIFPDRFARSQTLPKPNNLEPWDSPPTIHGFKGGDLIGVLERLDYLQDLGINAIYFNPIFESTANHRYHTYDYYRVDRILGGNSALRRLLDEAHRRGMRVVLDGVFNHASRGFFQFNHLLENGPASPYADWFVVHGWPLQAYDHNRPPNYASWWNLHALPKLNVHNPAVRQFLWDVGRYWIEQGVDGWRLDVPNEIDDDEFWREFRRQVKDANPEVYIVGEIWGDASHWLRGDQFDAVMNYLVTRACLGFFAGRTLNHSLTHNTGYGHVPTLDVAAFADSIDNILSLYPTEITQAQLNLLGSHDTPRFLTLARGDESALQLALLFLMTYPGAPCIYYGDEIGLKGARDPDCRRSFPWPNGADPAREGIWNVALLNYTRRTVALRHQYPALRRGRFIRLRAANDIYAFARRLDDAATGQAETLVVILNAGQDSRRPELSVAGLLPDNVLLQAVFGAGAAQVTAGRLHGVLIPPRSGLVLAHRG